MKKNDRNALKTMKKEELVAKLADLSKELSVSRVQHSLGRLKNTRILSMLCDDIARVKVVMEKV